MLYQTLPQTGIYQRATVIPCRQGSSTAVGMRNRRDINGSSCLQIGVAPMPPLSRNSTPTWPLPKSLQITALPWSMLDAGR
jgi:hypothetical protein